LPYHISEHAIDLGLRKQSDLWYPTQLSPPDLHSGPGDERQKRAIAEKKRLCRQKGVVVTCGGEPEPEYEINPGYEILRADPVRAATSAVAPEPGFRKR